MADAARDGNFVPTLTAVSNVDGVTPVRLYADPVTHRLLTSPTGAGSGDVVGPASSTDNAIARFDSTTGKLLQNSNVTISDTGVINVAGAYSLPIVDGTNGYVLTTNGSGTVSWQVITASNATTVTVADEQVDTTSFINFTTAATGNLGIKTNATLRFNAATGTLQADTVDIGGGTINGTDIGLITPGDIVGNLISATIAVSPLTNDGAALGTIVTQWSDLFLATGAVINFNNGDVTVTHSADTLAFAGAATAYTFSGGPIRPSANDGLSLGSSGTAFSDLYLASGALIDWAAGNMTLTQSSGVLTLSNTDAGVTGPIFELYQDSASPAASDDVGTIKFFGRDSAANKQEYARIEGTIVSPTSTTESGKMTLFVTASGAITSKLELASTDFSPTSNDGIALGTSTLSYADLFLASGGVINWNNGNATLTHSAGLLTSNVSLSLGTSNVLTTGTIELGAASDTTLSRSAAGVLAVEGVVIPSISSTNTLTNKRITKRTGTTTSSATPTINTDNVDFYSITAQTADITSFTTNLSGTPTEGQTLWIAITGTAARAITWGTSFEASTVALPTTTVSTNRLDVGFIWNTVTSKWRCIATA